MRSDVSGGARQVTASAAQRKRTLGDKQVANNVNKRGMVPDPSVEVRLLPCLTAHGSSLRA